MSDKNTLDPGDATRDVTRYVAAVQGQTDQRLSRDDVFGAYRIERLLGAGGMGEVYAAEHIDTGRRVALKTLNHNLETPDDRARFLREGRLAASISHPHCVYIFGTEEFDQQLAIVMELMPAGTLKDVVARDGPMPVGKAVDAILQVIDGLEAAGASGILHRDVKPANCFVDDDGTVKVGDFGLSISRLERDYTQLTVSGTIIGTPQFASPEQLSGAPLDARADIYSVGATLYYLLTRRCPFESEQGLVHLIGAVLHGNPVSPRQHRPEIPEQLERIVLRCLARAPSDRFLIYDDVRNALAPFGSADSTPPLTLPLRLARAEFGEVVLPFCLLYGARALSGLESSTPLPIWERAIIALVLFLYWVVSVRQWGAAIFDTRVVSLDGDRVSLSQSMIRAAVIVIAINLDVAGRLIWRLVEPGAPAPALLWWLPVLGFIACYSSVRRANGYSALHDLLSGTRVVIRQRAPRLDRVNTLLFKLFRRWTTASPTSSPPGKTVERPALTARVGPYGVAEALEGAPGLFDGFDDILGRAVWIQTVPEGTPPIPVSRRELGRAGRLRWLCGRREGADSWDAWEAFDGRPFLRVSNHPQSWHEVRNWLQDLSDELAAGLQTGSLPAHLGLDTVWVSESGRAKVVDLAVGPPSNSSNGDQGAPVIDVESTQRFLCCIGYTALHGRMPAAGTDAVPELPLPLRARDLLVRLARSGYSNITDISRELRARVHEGIDATVYMGQSRTVLALLSIVPIVVQVGYLVAFASAGSVSRTVIHEHRDSVRAAYHLQRMNSWLLTPETRQAREVITAELLRLPGVNPFLWWDRGSQSPKSSESVADTERRRRREGLIADLRARRPSPSVREIAASEEALRPLLARMEVYIDRQASANSEDVLLGRAAFGFVLLVYFLVEAIASAAFGRGVIMWLSGIVVVDRAGRPVSRSRLVARTSVAWLPAIGACLCFVGAAFLSTQYPGLSWESVLTYLGVVLCLAGLAGAFWPMAEAQFLWDRLLGTRLMPGRSYYLYSVRSRFERYAPLTTSRS